MPLASIVTAVVAAVGGLFVGTYATTLIERVPDDDAIRPAGRCPHCGERLRWSQMIPVVSYLRQGGRCVRCDKPYGRGHLIVEVVTALVFGVLGLRLGPSPDLAAYLYLAAAGVVLSGIDIACKRLPDVLTKPSYLAVGGLLAIAVPHTPGGPLRFVYAVIGMVVLLGIYFLLFVINPRGMAWGDVKLSGSLGLALGWLGADAFVVGAFAGFLLGAVSGLLMVAFGRLKMKSAIPFGPYMLAGTLIGVLLPGTLDII